MNPVVPHKVTIYNALDDGYSSATLENVRVTLMRGSGSAKGSVYILLSYLECPKPFVPYREWRLLSDSAKRGAWTAAGDGSDIILPRLYGECLDPLALPDALPITGVEYKLNEGSLSQIILFIGGA